jgi:hypothetical protein
MSDERREFFRIRYPSVERPEIDVGDDRFDVAELSEGGLRVFGEFEDLEAGHQVEGLLRLLCDSTLKITATFSRIQDGEAVFDNLHGVSFGEMMNEQRYLIRKYPSVKEE